MCFSFKTSLETISPFQNVTEGQHEMIRNGKDTPQLELLLRTVLYHRTSPSGHRNLLQNMESTETVKADNNENKTWIKKIRPHDKYSMYDCHGLKECKSLKK